MYQGKVFPQDDIVIARV